MKGDGAQHKQVTNTGMPDANTTPRWTRNHAHTAHTGRCPVPLLTHTCCVLMSTPDSQQPKPGWLWYQPTTISGLIRDTREGCTQRDRADIHTTHGCVVVLVIIEQCDNMQGKHGKTTTTTHSAVPRATVWSELHAVCVGAVTRAPTPLRTPLLTCPLA